jgi:Ca2+-binding RTX toxin-like protein
VIDDYSYNKRYYGDTGILKIGEGVDPSKIEITRVNNDIIFIISETGERLTVKNWYAADYYQLTKIEFGEGTVWTRSDINAMMPVLHGTNDGETINGYSTSDVIHGYDGDDIIDSGGGHDIIAGGKGLDFLASGDGHDVYIWKLGDGNDVIDDYSYNKRYYGDTGVLKIGGAVDPEKIENTRVGNDLILIIAESGERLTVKDWYAASYYQLTRIEFEDGTVWTAADVNAKPFVLRGTDDGETIQGFSGSDVIHGHGGSDLIAGNDGHDVYIWKLGDGNDVIDDYSYNKRYYGDTGILNIGAEVDPTLIELTRNNNDLVCTFGQTGEFVTVQNWYSADYYQLTSMNFANGTTWTRANINAIADGTLAPFSTNP